MLVLQTCELMSCVLKGPKSLATQIFPQLRCHLSKDCAACKLAHVEQGRLLAVSVASIRGVAISYGFKYSNRLQFWNYNTMDPHGHMSDWHHSPIADVNQIQVFYSLIQCYLLTPDVWRNANLKRCTLINVYVSFLITSYNSLPSASINFVQKTKLNLWETIKVLPLQELRFVEQCGANVYGVTSITQIHIHNSHVLTSSRGHPLKHGRASAYFEAWICSSGSMIFHGFLPRNESTSLKRTCGEPHRGNLGFRKWWPKGWIGREEPAWRRSRGQSHCLGAGAGMSRLMRSPIEVYGAVLSLWTTQRSFCPNTLSA